MTARLAISSDTVMRLDHGWRMALSPAGACSTPKDAAALADWIAAPVPGTAAEALRQAGQWSGQALHDQDAWYRLDLHDVGVRALRFEGLATLAEAWLDERLALTSRNMFTPAEVEVDLAGGETLWLCFRALAPTIAERGPRVRWRPQMITPQGVRLVRTTLFGHMPGWCPSVDAVGPWREVSLIERGPARASEVRITADFDGVRGVLRVEPTLNGVEAPVLECAGQSAAMQPLGSGRFLGELTLDAIVPWWPHTHGGQPLYPVTVRCGTTTIALGRTGFRRIEVERGEDGRGFGLRVNGEPVFCRGACWSSPDIVALPGDRDAYRPWLELARDAHSNMIRVPGTGVYETADFFALCDELGILVWQDAMLANFDYPADEGFTAAISAEIGAFLATTQGSPSLAVLCGGSEAFQQAAMMGLPADAWGGPADKAVAEECARLRPDIPYVPNSPSGGALPFVVDQGVGHYYGVGAYLRPLEDARRAGVRFASECLAFANLPQALPDAADPAAGVPRDRGADWDFADVRDHYLGLLYRVDPARLRTEDPALYLDLSRAVTGEVMEATFAEWRRGRSPTQGGLVLAWQDLRPGAGWGVIDSSGEPKPAFYALRRAFRPVQLTLTDEGVNGLAIHLVNDGAAAVPATAELTCLRDGQIPILSASRAVRLEPRSAGEISAFDLIGGFFDLTYAYRFGQPEHDAVVVRLVGEAGELLAEAVHFPQGRGQARPAPVIQTQLEQDACGWTLVLVADRLAESVHIEDAAFRAEDDWFHLTPGREIRIALRPRPTAHAGARPGGEVRGPGGVWRTAY
jgi:beta-mannosidase